MFKCKDLYKCPDVGRMDPLNLLKWENHEEMIISIRSLINKWSQFEEDENGIYRKRGIKGLIEPVSKKLERISKVCEARI